MNLIALLRHAEEPAADRRLRFQITISISMVFFVLV